MNYYLYGFIESKEENSFGPIGFEWEEGEKTSVRVLPNGNLAAVVAKPPCESFEGISKEILMKALLTHQQTLETIMKGQFVLPCKFGTVLKEDEVRGILSRNASSMTQWFQKMKDTFEIDTMALWKPQEILKEMAARDPEIAELKKSGEGKLSIGMRLAAKLRKEALIYAQEILKLLKEVSLNQANHDVMNDEMVLNASFLLPRGGEEPFFKALETLDQKFGGKLTFRCVGPLPPYSFATVTIRRFGPMEIQWAQKRLGTYRSGDIQELKRAYKKLARELHPDTHPEIHQKEFEEIHRAYELLIDYHEGGCQPMKVSLWSATEAGNL